MSKAILVMDMPAACSKCKFSYEFTGVKRCYILNNLFGGASRLSESNYTIQRHEKCPIQPLPERIESDDLEKHYETGYRNGWNGCIESIQKERE